MEGLKTELKHFMSIPVMDWDEATQNAVVALQRRVISHLENAKKSELFFLTVNFKPDTTVYQVIEACDRISRRSFVQKYWYNIEQRGTSLEDMGKGLHTHFLFFSTTPISQVKRDIYNTVKCLVGNQLHVDLKRYPTEYLNDKIDYLNGKKWDPEKLDKVNTDKLFREEYMLSTIYSNGLSS